MIPSEVSRARKIKKEEFSKLERWNILLASHDEVDNGVRSPTSISFLARLFLIFSSSERKKKSRNFALLPAKYPRIVLDLSSRKSFFHGIRFYRFGSLKGQLFQFFLKIFCLFNCHYFLLNRIIAIDPKNDVASDNDVELFLPEIRAFLQERPDEEIYYTLYLGKPSASTAITVLRVDTAKDENRVYKIFDERYYDFAEGSHIYESEVLQSLQNYELCFSVPSLHGTYKSGISPRCYSFSVDYMFGDRPVHIGRDCKILVDSLISMIKAIPAVKDASFSTNSMNIHAVDFVTYPVLKDVFYEVFSGEKGFYRGFSHGDFTIWNMNIKSSKLQVLDWENFSADGNLLGDFFSLQFSHLLFPFRPKELRARFSDSFLMYEEIRPFLPEDISIDAHYAFWVISLDLPKELNEFMFEYFEKSLRRRS